MAKLLLVKDFSLLYLFLADMQMLKSNTPVHRTLQARPVDYRFSTKS